MLDFCVAICYNMCSMNQAILNMRMDKKLKRQLGDFAAQVGLPISTVVESSVRRTLSDGSITFSASPVMKFNHKTEKALEEARKIMDGKIKSKIYKNAHELLADA